MDQSGGDDSVNQEDQNQQSVTKINVSMPGDEPMSEDDVSASNDAISAQLETAEEAVSEAGAESVSQELAEVADELTAASQPQLDASGGSDPMEQILASESTQAEQPSDDEKSFFETSENDNATEISPEDISDGVEVDDSSTESMTASENLLDTSKISSEEAGQPENGSPDTGMQEDGPTDSENSSVVENLSPQPELDSVQVEADTSVSSTNEAVQMANEAELASTPDVDPASVVNEVVSPTAVSVAQAEGTAGENVMTGSPETATVETAQQAPKVSKPHADKSNKGILIAVVALITLLFGGAAIAAYMLQPTNDTKTENKLQQDNTSETLTTDNDKVLSSSDTAEFKAVCGGKGVSTAPAYTRSKISPILIFEKGIDNEFAQSIVEFSNDDWYATDAGEVELVGCIERKQSSEKKLSACQIKDTNGATSTVDLYSTTYIVNVYESQTAKIVVTFDNQSTDTTCPANPVYSKADPKIFAPIDIKSLETSLSGTVDDPRAYPAQ